jgi:hypothetical protein
MSAKSKLREISAELDPLRLLEEMRAVQAYLASLADGETPPPMTSEPPNLAAFVSGRPSPRGWDLNPRSGGGHHHSESVATATGALLAQCP